ncbi:MAG: hypothetical protein RL154_1446 [Pseudomonadota bacterium]|jgi:diaminopimelate epimerase
MILTKLCASGNDFLIFHTFKRADYSELAKSLCDRKYGIGADGLIALIPHSELDFEWLFYNADGSVADMCGNGARAAALFAYTQNLANKKQQFLTGAGIISAEVFEDNQSEVILTTPKQLDIDCENYLKIDTGVPHLTQEVDNLDEFDIIKARELRHKYNANINCYKIVDNEIHIRTYERGVEDETLACGTGMAAAVYSIILKSQTKQQEFIVRPKSGEKLIITYKNSIISLKGLVKIIGTIIC